MTPTPLLDRSLSLKQLVEKSQWDVIVIGGGATGLGIALDAASRGFSVLLLEQSDFAKGTSSRSTKLIHGGVRYLAQGNIRLVYSALKERGHLLHNAPHLVRRQSFIIPCYSFFSKMKYGAGLKFYDWLSGRYSFGQSRLLDAAEVLAHLPSLKADGLVGGIQYFDGQFDDARLAVNLAQTAAAKGAVLVNYCGVTALQKEGRKVTGVVARDGETGTDYPLQARVVINATGVFVDAVLRMDVPEAAPLVRSSQGIHLVLDGSFLEGSSALMIPETSDGRVLFAVPWHHHVLLGTTDTPLDAHSLEPVALESEIRFILDTVRPYMKVAPRAEDVLSVFAGLRPLAAPEQQTGATREISRDHKLMVSDSGLVTITGGKWTTYRKMAEETVDQAIISGGLAPVACCTRDLPIHGCMAGDAEHPLAAYGTDRAAIELLQRNEPLLARPLIAGLPYTEAEVVWAVRHEMARTVEDVLARRLRLLFLDAQAALQAAPRVAALLAAERQQDAVWAKAQVAAFSGVAAQYLLRNLVPEGAPSRLHGLAVE